MAIEIHGKRHCPFAWRVRLAAAEKAVPFEWLPFDVAAPDPRVAAHNPEKKSPLLVHGEFTLRESAVIAQYVDEAFPGRALMPSDPKQRAELRLAQVETTPVEQGHAPPGQHPSEEQKKRARKAIAALEKRLSGGDAYLGGTEPMLPDLLLWPFLSMLADEAFIPADHTAVHAYVARFRARPSFSATKPV